MGCVKAKPFGMNLGSIDINFYGEVLADYFTMDGWGQENLGIQSYTYSLIIALYFNL